MPKRDSELGCRFRFLPVRCGVILLAGVAFLILPNLSTRASESRSQQVLHDAGEFTAAQCASCHRMKEGFSHPLNVPAPVEARSHLPTANGKITCLTCHESSIQAHRASRDRGDMLLRSENAVNLCVHCHDPSDPSREAQHALALGSAHLGEGKHGSVGTSRRSALYLETNNCLSCHDGLISTDTAMSEIRLPGGALEEHPVAVPYRERREAASVIELTPASHLDPGIRLFDGQIGCGTCHSPYSTQPKLLVMSNRGSRLCLSCHKT